MFTLDPRLQHDTFPVTRLALSEVLLMNDARYPWCILVPRVDQASEIFHLSESDQHQWWQETRSVAQRMQQHFRADKMNIATLGNQVSQLHMHIIARTRDDAAWPHPVWGKHPALAYSASQAEARVAELRTLFDHEPKRKPHHERRGQAR